MNRFACIFLLLCFFLAHAENIQAQRLHNEIQWDELPPVPPEPGAPAQPGVVGAFAGANNNVLILAGRPCKMTSGLPPG